jgi:hypothetical protein
MTHLGGTRNHVYDGIRRELGSDPQNRHSFSFPHPKPVQREIARPKAPKETFFGARYIQNPVKRGS